MILRACLSQIVPPFISHFSLFFPGQVKLSGSICRVSTPQGKYYFIMNPRTCWSFCWCDCQRDTCQKGQGLWRCLKCGKRWEKKITERNRKREQTPSVLRKSGAWIASAGDVHGHVGWWQENTWPSMGNLTSIWHTVSFLKHDGTAKLVFNMQMGEVGSPHTTAWNYARTVTHLVPPASSARFGGRLAF